MKNRNDRSEQIRQKILEGKEIISQQVNRNRQYYLDNTDIEKQVSDRATAMAERIIVATLRESQVSVQLDVDDLANRVVEKLGKKIILNQNKKDQEDTDFLDEENKPENLKIEKYEIKGKIGKKTQECDSTEDALEALLNLSI